MAKNRKHGSSTVRFAPALKVLLICLMVGSVGLGYVRQKSQLYALGAQYKECELRFEKLRRENAIRASLLDFLRTPTELEVRVKQMNLGLAPPPPSQIVRLKENGSEAETGTSRLYYVERQRPSVNLR